MDIHQFQSFKGAIARIYHYQHETVIGAGFLVTPCHVLTCAHVVTAALGLSTNTQEQPTATVCLDFPLTRPGVFYEARVVMWCPVNPGDSKEDIAGLELTTALGATLSPVQLCSTDEVWDHPLRVFGFPKNHEDGLWATGTMRDRIANGWVQLDAIMSQQRAIEPGFSGAPIWDEQVSGVVGMAVAAEKRRQDVTAAYMIPALILKSSWDVLEVKRGDEVMSDASMPKFRGVKVIKARELRNQFGRLEEEYEALYNQLGSTLSEADRLKLQRQIQGIEQEMKRVERSLESLKSGGELFESSADSAVEPIHQVRLRAKQKTYEHLVKKYEALEDQISSTRNADDKIDLQSRLDRVVADMETVYQEIQSLSRG